VVVGGGGKKVPCLGGGTEVEAETTGGWREHIYKIKKEKLQTGGENKIQLSNNVLRVKARKAQERGWMDGWMGGWMDRWIGGKGRYMDG